MAQDIPQLDSVKSKPGSMPPVGEDVRKHTRPLPSWSFQNKDSSEVTDLTNAPLTAGKDLRCYRSLQKADGITQRSAIGVPQGEQER